MEAQLWSPGVNSQGWPLVSALNYGGGTPFPGPYLTDSGIPGGLYAQPAFNESLGGVSQAWKTSITIGGGSTNTTIQEVSSGKCLVPAPLSTFNVWARWLAGGDVALLFVNFASSPATVTCDSACMAALAKPRHQAAPSLWKARDVWLHQPIGTISQADGFTTSELPAEGGSTLLRLTPS